MPEWILSEVAVLSKISCVRLKLITRQVINELTGGRLDVEKVCKLAPKESGKKNLGWCMVREGRTRRLRYSSPISYGRF